jgi:flavodoxin
MAKKLKILIVYYSRTGNTRQIAEKLSKKLNADIEKIKSVDFSGFWGYLLGIFDIIFRKKPQIEFSKNPKEYDLVILGSPIWGETFSSPVRHYLTKNKDKIKKIAFFCSRGGGEIKKAITEINNLVGPPISVLNVLAKEVKEDNYKAKLDKFIKELK